MEQTHKSTDKFYISLFLPVLISAEPGLLQTPFEKICQIQVIELCKCINGMKYNCLSYDCL